MERELFWRVNRFVKTLMLLFYYKLVSIFWFMTLYSWNIHETINFSRQSVTHWTIVQWYLNVLALLIVVAETCLVMTRLKIQNGESFTEITVYYCLALKVCFVVSDVFSFAKKTLRGRRANSLNWQKPYVNSSCGRNKSLVEKQKHI